MDNNIGYIICETSSEPQKPNIIGESGGRVKIEACLQDMEVKNRNGRYYSKSELGPAVQSTRIKELIENDSFFGEAGHPMSTELTRQATIDPTNMSHKFTKLWVDGNNIMANVVAADTARGDDFNRLVMAGTKVAFSMRALGMIKNTAKGAEVIQPKVMTWDWVIYPSHSVAYMTKLLSESAMIAELEESNKFVLEENDKGILEPINKKNICDYIKDQSKNIKNVQESLGFLYESIEYSPNKDAVLLKDKKGTSMVIKIETHILQEIRNYCSSIY